MSNSPSTHRPSLVLELPPDRWVYCLACQKPWPCPDAPADSRIEMTHDPLCPHHGIVNPEDAPQGSRCQCSLIGRVRDQERHAAKCPWC